MESPHDVLGVDADADDDELRRAYRERAKETHPDRGGTRREFLLVQRAYEELLAGRGGEADGSIEEDDDEWLESRVEYLDYEVLDDYDWDLDDGDLFEKAAAAELDPADYGRFLVRPHETLLEAAENRGFTWPYSCRGGACANCAVAVTEGDVEMSVNHVLPRDLLDRGIRLSCIGAPTARQLRVVYNVKHLPDVEDLLLPPGPFREAWPND